MREDGCGNVVPMETKKRFPQGLGNLAQNARFPHSHKPIIHSSQKGEDEERRPGSATAESTRDLNDLDLRICLDNWVHFKCVVFNQRHMPKGVLLRRRATVTQL